MTIKLFDYQIDAIQMMKNGCILCGGVGSGKSLTSLGYYYICQGGYYSFLRGGDYVEMKNPKDLYIITTARKRDTFEWSKELSHYYLSIYPEDNLYSNKVIVDSWNNIKKYADVTDAFFIFDEQRVIGYGAWTKTFLKIVKSNKWILLSATPGDTWSDYIPVFVANGFYKNKTEFERLHAVYKNVAYLHYPKIDHYIHTGRLIKLRNQILIDMDFERKTKAHHEDIPVRYDIDLYKQVGKTRWDPFKNEPIKSPSELCYVWRKIVNTDDSRQVALMEIFEDHPKLIIFYNFDYELDILRELFSGIDVPYAEWNGHKHEEIPKTDTWAYLVQYSAGAEGWNCIETDTIVFYSQTYSFKTQQQASGRIDRLNTPFTNLYYYHLRSRSGIDLAIAKALKEKKNFNEKRYTKW